MTAYYAQLSAVLGPTNTGKTHLAVERMSAHSGGMMGFPLRLLAREAYDRVVALKGAAQVALVTGEERIVPPTARYFLCTAESMVTDRTFPFVAIDEGQMGADPERGHVFTNAMLHLRGTAETMILGAGTLRPLINRLLPDAHIIERPRFSKLAWEEPRKLSRLPKRTAIVAFTAEDVYALAEMLRRHKGGAAVVMGGLSPRTRNAQVALYQSGEVDYLVATDAIGMGLNMDISHVAFASLSKFDGRRHRRLQPAEMAQIAGRAGRHQRNGTFGTVQMGRSAPEDSLLFTNDEISAIEQHRFPPLRGLVWRNHRLDVSTLRRLVASLEATPAAPDLWRGDDAADLQVLKLLASQPWVVERAVDRKVIERLWAACGLPDYRRTGAEAHSRLVGRVFRYRSEGAGRLPDEWIRAELAVLDNVAGDIATLSDRIAAARTWTYISHRGGWLNDAAHWAERARQVEDRLSDALHERLTQRFVDRRTSVLLRDLKMRSGEVRVEVDPDGAVVVDGAIIGTLSGFAFLPDPTARAGEKKLLLAAAERRLQSELQRRAGDLAGAADAALSLGFEGDMPPRLLWLGAPIAALRRGRDALNPRIDLHLSLSSLPEPWRQAIQLRLGQWLQTVKQRHLGALIRLEKLKPHLSAPARGLVVQLTETMGVLPRLSVEPLIGSLTSDDRQALVRAGVRLGSCHVFATSALRPEATRWRLALWAVHAGIARMPPPPRAGLVRLQIDPLAPPGYYGVAGYWAIDDFAVRVDIAERIAGIVHEQRRNHRAAGGTGGFLPNLALAGNPGLAPAEFSRLCQALGFRHQRQKGFSHAGALQPRRDKAAHHPNPSHPFAALGRLLGGAAPSR